MNVIRRSGNISYKIMMVIFTWNYQGVKVLITSLYHSVIIATSSIISLMNGLVKICQLPVTNVRDDTKQMIVTVTLWRSVWIAYKIVRETSNIMFFSRECPAMVKARAFAIRKTDRRRLTDLAQENSLIYLFIHLFTVRD